jgi:FKBP-type peptidyl-prolyl cis-trans isomerase SlyD
MQIEKNTAVTLNYKVFDQKGHVLAQPKEPMSYLHGGYGNTLEKIEQALQGQMAGYQITLVLEPQDAFGLRDEQLVRTIPKSQFPPGIKVGGELEGRTEDGRTMLFYVVKIKGSEVHLDGNHPWAGKTLRFSVTVTGVRAATEEEIAHGHVHGAHGHQH